MAVLVDAKRLRPIQDLHTWSPDCMVAADDSFELRDEFLLITDPIHFGQTVSASAGAAGDPGRVRVCRARLGARGARGVAHPSRSGGTVGIHPSDLPLASLGIPCILVPCVPIVPGVPLVPWWC